MRVSYVSGSGADAVYTIVDDEQRTAAFLTFTGVLTSPKGHRVDKQSDFGRACVEAVTDYTQPER